MPSKTSSTNRRQLNQLLTQGAECLAKAGIDSAWLDAELLMAQTLNQDRAFVLSHGDKIISPAQQKRFRSLIGQRFRRYPLAYLLGHKEFYGLDFTVTPDVLVPRPESELMVELARQEIRLDSLLIDLGTGSGCIAIALAPYFPKIFAVDISAKALAVAKKNAKQHGVQHTTFYQSDLLEKLPISKFPSHLVITANLPYVSQKLMKEPSIQKEPKLALYGGKDGLDVYRKLALQLEKIIGPRIILLCEINPEQKEPFKKIWKRKKFEFIKDLSGKTRIGKIILDN